MMHRGCDAEKMYSQVNTIKMKNKTGEKLKSNYKSGTCLFFN